MSAGAASRASNGHDAAVPSATFALKTPTDFGFPFQPCTCDAASERDHADCDTPIDEIQLELMTHLYKAIEQSKVAVLESPTGTVGPVSLIAPSRVLRSWGIAGQIAVHHLLVALVAARQPSASHRRDDGPASPKPQAKHERRYAVGFGPLIQRSGLMQSSGRTRVGATARGRAEEEGAFR